MTPSRQDRDAAAESKPYFVGIDVAKAKLDLARTDDSRVLTVSNDQAGIAQIVASLIARKPQCIVIESTGGLERPLRDALLEADLPVAVVNPGNVRHFALGLGILAKTDAIDARVLAQFAERAIVRFSEKRSQNQAQLDALVTCRRQLVASKTVVLNQRGSTSDKEAKDIFSQVIDSFNSKIKILDQKIAKLIKSDDDFGEKAKLLASVPGVGPVLSSTLLAELHELGTTDPKRISALVGVAPMANDSGDRKGPRSIRGGRTAVRNTLYMATVAAIRPKSTNAVLLKFANRLRAAGKKPMVVITAAMRKLIVLLNAMLRDKITWQELNVAKIA